MDPAHESEPPTRTSDGLLGGRLRFDVLLAVFAGIVLLTALTRFASLGTRVMSHDETTHVYFSWQLEQGRGYSHDPLSHGPLQFHLLALAYFLFGDTDATARLWAAIAGVVAVLMIWPFRRWIGRLSAVVTAALIFASPFMLYYARYARNEAFVVVEALLMFWAVFSYLERRRSTSLYLLAASLALHFSTKETSFIYAAQLLLILAVFFLWEALHKDWGSARRKIVFLVGIAAAAVGWGAALLVFLRDRTAAREAATLVVSPLVGMGVVLGVAGLILAAVALVLSFRRRLRTEFPAFDLLIVSGTLVLPHLASLPAAALGWDPLAYSDPAEWGRTLALVIALIVISAGIGLLWNWKRWLIAGGLFAAIYIPLFTTLFTNPQGLATGLVGSLGYWLVQQGVQRANQPLYYYALIEIPFYEYLAGLGALVAAGMGIAALIRGPRPGEMPSNRADRVYDIGWLYPLFFGYWSITALVLYTFAGERMPWLTVHIALPMILLSGWVFGRFLGKVEWSRIRRRAHLGAAGSGGAEPAGGGALRRIAARSPAAVQRDGAREPASDDRDSGFAPGGRGGRVRRRPSRHRVDRPRSGTTGGRRRAEPALFPHAAHRSAGVLHQLRRRHRVPGLRPLGRRSQAGAGADRRIVPPFDRRARSQPGLRQ